MKNPKYILQAAPRDLQHKQLIYEPLVPLQARKVAPVKPDTNNSQWFNS